MDWITVHPNGEENKGQPIPVKEGQTKKEAVKSFIEKHKNKNVEELQNEITYETIGKSSKKQNKVYSNDDIEKLIVEISKEYVQPTRGTEDLNLKKVLNKLNFSDKPIKASKKDLIDIIGSSKILFRGINGEKAEEYKKQFYNGEMFVGTGLGGNGVYMSIDKSEAISYNKGTGVTVCALMPSNFKIADKNVREEYEKFYNAIKEKYSYNKSNSKEANNKNSLVLKTTSYGLYCAMKGYDAYIPTINPEKNMVILNRGKLVIGENNEQEYFLEQD